MIGPRRIASALAAALAGALAAVAVVAVCAPAARRRLVAVRRSIRTSSSPGAAAYGLLSGRLLDGYYRDIAADCATAVAGAGASRILEIGPGPGHLAAHLLEALPTAHWTGLDIDPAMLAATQSRLDAAGLSSRATLVEGDVTTLPFDDASFDLVVSSLSAHHWPDAAAGFREIRRVLRPGGIALVYDLPARWGRLETGSAGIRTAGAVFAAPRIRRFRGLGPLTIIERVEVGAPPG